jgi:hypothetical protein
LFFRVAIPAVTILSIHKRLRTPECTPHREDVACVWRSDGLKPAP